MTLTESAVAAWRGRNAVDSDGNKIGSIDEIYMDAETGRPEWLAVKTGMFGSKVSFVPIAQASESNGDVRLPYDNVRWSLLNRITNVTTLTATTDWYSMRDIPVVVDPDLPI